MAVEVQTTHFSGPLDLLLSLVAEKKMSITELALAEVTEQYVHSIDVLEEKDPDELADFLVIATKLLLLKSKSLLPQFFPEEEDGPSLAEQLKLYKAFVDASKEIHDIWENSNKTYFRIEPTRRPTEFVPPGNFVEDKMHACMVQLVHRLAPLKPLPQVKIDKTVSIKERISHMKIMLKKVKQVRFAEMLGESANKTEIIVGFLAILELVKQQAVSLKQSDAFDDILVSSL
jgi:segregation and condensation protein A